MYNSFWLLKYYSWEYVCFFFFFFCLFGFVFFQSPGDCSSSKVRNVMIGNLLWNCNERQTLCLSFMLVLMIFENTAEQQLLQDHKSQPYIAWALTELGYWVVFSLIPPISTEVWIQILHFR